MLKELSTKQPKGLNNTFESVIAVLRWNWNLEVLVFKEKRKPEYREKNLLEQRGELVTKSTKIWRRSTPQFVLVTVSSLRHPCSPCMTFIVLDLKIPEMPYLYRRPVSSIG